MYLKIKLGPFHSCTYQHTSSTGGQRRRGGAAGAPVRVRPRPRAAVGRVPRGGLGAGARRDLRHHRRGQAPGADPHGGHSSGSRRVAQ